MRNWRRLLRAPPVVLAADAAFSASTLMVRQDVDNDRSISGAVQRVVEGSQQVLLAHINSLRLEVKDDLGRALSSIVLIGAGVILINGAWLALMVFAFHEVNDRLSLVASLAIVGSVNGLIGVGLAIAGARRLRPSKGEAEAAQLEPTVAPLRRVTFGPSERNPR